MTLTEKLDAVMRERSLLPATRASRLGQTLLPVTPQASLQWSPEDVHAEALSVRSPLEALAC